MRALSLLLTLLLCASCGGAARSDEPIRVETIRMTGDVRCFAFIQDGKVVAGHCLKDER